MDPTKVEEPVSDDEEFSDDDENEYMLGFPEEVYPTAVLRHRFPSKLGGRPAWLDPVFLPTQQQLTCGATGQQLNFLLQVYAPLDEDEGQDGDHAFHRALFMFVTPQGDNIHKPGTVRVFRCQLPRKNDYYAYEPPGEEDETPQSLPDELKTQSLSRDPWRVLEAEAALAEAALNMKDESNNADSAATDAAAAQLKDLDIRPGGGASAGVRLEARVGSKQFLVLYPERELVVEPEDRESEEEQTAVEKLLSEYNTRVEEEGDLTEEELPPEIMDQIEQTHTLERKHFAMFQARIDAAPEQAIRYCFKPGARPLWPSPTNIPSPSDIPHCPHCKSLRRFEFQVMPQLINSLEQDELQETSLDWSTLAVYSCPNSCAEGVEAMKRQGSAYVEEFVWVQPPV